MCGKHARTPLVDLPLPSPLLGAIFQQLDLCSRPAWTATCQAFRVAALQALGRSMVSRALARHHPGRGFGVAEPRFLATLTMLHELVVDLDARSPGISADDVLAALAAVLACLPHCRRGSGTPRLRLCVRLALAPGCVLPQLEAYRLQHLLQDVGLLHSLDCVQLDTPCFSLDGGLAGVLCAAWLTAEQHLLDGTTGTIAYARLRTLELDLGRPQSLELFAELVYEGQFPGVQRLKLARQYTGDSLPLPWDAVEMGRREAVLCAIAAARSTAHEAGSYDVVSCSSRDGGEAPPHPLDCAGPVAPPPEMRRLRLLQPTLAGACRVCGQRGAGCPCQDTYVQLLEEHHPCYSGADLSCLRRLPQLTSLELTNFDWAARPPACALPRLPALRALALTHQCWFQRHPGFREFNVGGELAAALGEALPGLRSLQMECVAGDQGMAAFKGLTSLTIAQSCGWQYRDQFGQFGWEMCRLRRLEEVQLRGGWGWMAADASWRGLLQPKRLPFSNPFQTLPHLQRLVFDVRGWGKLPEQPRLEEFLGAVLDVFVNSNDQMRSLASIHAVLEDGPYCTSKNAEYLAQEGPLGEWGAAYDDYGQLWVAVLAAEQTPKVLLMQQMSRGKVGLATSTDGAREEWSSEGDEQGWQIE